MAQYLTDLENWATNNELKESLLQKVYWTSWITTYVYNVTFVFIFIPFGEEVYNSIYENCAAENGLTGARRFYKMFGMLSSFDASYGVYNPGNTLIVGEWIGLIFDLIVLRVAFWSLIPHCVATAKRKKREKMYLESKIELGVKDSNIPKVVAENQVLPLNVDECTDMDTSAEEMNLEGKGMNGMDWKYGCQIIQSIEGYKFTCILI